MATTQDHIAARNDGDLRERLIAKAEQLGLDDPGQRIHNVMGRLIAVPVDGAQTITDVYAYANNVRNEYMAATPRRAGENPGAVLDTHLETALRAVLADEIPEGN